MNISGFCKGSKHAVNISMFGLCGAENIAINTVLLKQISLKYMQCRFFHDDLCFEKRQPAAKKTRSATKKARTNNRNPVCFDFADGFFDGEFTQLGQYLLHSFNCGETKKQ